MGALRVSGVISVKGRQRDASAFVILGVHRRLDGESARMGALVWMPGALGVEPGLRRETSEYFDFIEEAVVGPHTRRK